MDNLMPGDNSGAEPAEHYRTCRTNCEHADYLFDLEEGLDLLMNAAANLSWWHPGKSLAIVEAVQVMNTDALRWLECPEGHRSHECNCEDIARTDAEDAAYWPSDV